MNRIVLSGGVILAASMASATDLNFSGSADDAFVAYVSTNPNVTGTSFVSGSSWGVTYTGNFTLTPGTTNYLHIDAFDVAGAPSMLIAQLGLSDSSFWFDDMTQSALSGDSNWSASLVGFGGATTPIIDEGVNGTSPWGSRPNIDPNAHFVWTDGNVSDHRYFTVQINTVPEPAELTVLGLGILPFLRLRKGC
ncbi:MAG: hypothetical protein GC165_09035 [Armatimonadetes bacterium]|nr:hypothetical protein [Armatimonadota bacterium]MBS1728726.1 hypothetical protein [Armatimonadota bacterium]